MIDKEKFCCLICANYNREEDKCRMTGATDIAWRAHRTCCGREDWHKEYKPTIDYAHVARELRFILSLDELTKFIHRLQFLEKALELEEILKYGNND